MPSGSKTISEFQDGSPPVNGDMYVFERNNITYRVPFSAIQAAIVAAIPVSSGSATIIPGTDGLDGEDGLSIPGRNGTNGLNGNFIQGNDGEDGDHGVTIIGPQGISGPQGQVIILEADQPEDPLVAKGEKGDRGTAGTNFVVMLTDDNVAEDIVPPVPSPNNSPVSAVTTPAVPGTGVAIKNNTGVDVTVYIKGGTLTVITVGGVATGIAAAAAANTAHSIPVAMNQTIAITYTVAPTWVWVGS
jgi:hypothetical protein